MFESLKHWFASIDEQSHLFEHSDSEVVHVALASLLFHVIKADGVESSREKSKFRDIMVNEFELSTQQVDSLYDYANSLNSELNSDLATINDHLKDNPHLRMRFMEKLNLLISVDGVSNSELDIFYQAMKVIFPDVAKQLCEK